MSRTTEHIRRVLNPAVCCCRCGEPLRPSEVYRQRVLIREDYADSDYQRDVAHSACVSEDELWDLFEDPPPYKRPPLDGLTEAEQHILLHSLGMGTHIDQRKHGYRNHYCAANGEPALEALVAKGLMVRGCTLNEGKHRYYLVSRAGAEKVGRPDLGVVDTSAEVA